MYFLTQSGTKITSISTAPTRTVSTAFCMGQTSGAVTVPVLPNSSRAACTRAETGFQLAKVSSALGRFCYCTKALEMKVSGNRIMKDALLMTSGDFTDMPSSAMTQLNA